MANFSLNLSLGLTIFAVEFKCKQYLQSWSEKEKLAALWHSWVIGCLHTEPVQLPKCFFKYLNYTLTTFQELLDHLKITQWDENSAQHLQEWKQQKLNWRQEAQEWTFGSFWMFNKKVLGLSGISLSVASSLTQSQLSALHLKSALCSHLLCFHCHLSHTPVLHLDKLTLQTSLS